MHVVHDASICYVGIDKWRTAWHAGCHIMLVLNLYREFKQKLSASWTNMKACA